MLISICLLLLNWLIKLYTFQKIFQMLMKPPSILDEVISQDSENYTVQSKQQSMRGKNGKKENTIKIGGSNQHKERSNDRDNDSVHSNGSKKSKDKRAKQTTLGRPKISQGYSQKDQDSHSVHSNGSKHSHKSAKKETNIMQRPKIQHPYNKPKTFGDNQLSFKHAIGGGEESMINLYKLEDNESPKPIRYVNEPKQEKREKADSKKKYAPFAEIQHKYSSEEEIPIVRIQQPVQHNKVNVVGINKFQQNRFNARPEDKREITESNVYNTQQSKSVFDQSKMGNTKSVRRPIFSKDELNNTSKMSFDQSNISGIDGSSRRKSNSKLRQLFNNSREKNSIEQSVMENQSKMSSMGELQSQSRAIKPAVGNDNRMVQLQRKVVDSENDNFGIDSIRSGLDLTVSNHEPLIEKERDSLIFEFQPERKKGMTVTTKNKKLGNSEEEFISIKDKLVSKNPQVIASSGENLPNLKNENIISKDLNQVDKLLRENQQFLKNSGLLNLSSSDKPKRLSEDEYLFKLDDEEPEMLGNWNTKPVQKQESINIKKVERNENYSTKERERQQKVQQKEKQKVQQRVVEQIKPVEKPKIITEQQPAKVRTNRRQRPEIREEVQEVIKQPVYVTEEKTKPKRQNDNKKRQQVRQTKSSEYYQENTFEEPKAELKVKQEKQEYIKSPGKIQKNFQSSPYKDDADSKSEKSNKSAKKGKIVKESAIPRGKNIKIEIKNDGPRCEDSFYEESQRSKKEEMSINDLSLYSKKVEERQEKKPNLYHFSDQQNFQANEKPKSRTDVNFYDNQVRSNRPPSSRPPLSGKSAKSRSTSKDKVTKQTTLKISANNPQTNKNPFKKSQQPAKKLTLMERAMMKHNESSEDDRSQESFSEDNYSQNSRKSSNSKGSRRSIKENSIKINPKETNLAKAARPPYQQKLSSNSSSHEEQLQQIERKRSIQHQKNAIVSQRAIISKNCTFIDEKGRLVQKDLVIKGKQIYGQSRVEDSTAQAFNRMRRTKESRRSRSRSRSHEKRRGSKEMGQSSYQNSSYCDSFYENSSYARNTGGRTSNNNIGYTNNGFPNTQTLALKEFIKPVEQVPLYNQGQNNERRGQKYYQQDQPVTLNDMFARKNPNPSHNYQNSNISESRSRRSLKRTEKSASKR